MFRSALEPSVSDDVANDDVCSEHDEYCCSRETFSRISNVLPQVLENLAVAASIAPSTESPIEVLFGAEFVKFCNQRGLKFSPCKQSAQNDVGADRILLMPQYEWKRYRIDWAVKVPFLKAPFFFIECDGRDFHSTDAQIMRDRQKDHAIKDAGIFIFRFTGSDLERNAAACVRFVFDVIDRQYLTELRMTLAEMTILKDFRECYFKVELPFVGITFVNNLTAIHEFHSTRGVVARQGVPERRFGQSRESVRWYFKNLEDADAFQKSFGGRLICSSAV